MILNGFEKRHIGLNPKDITKMLEKLGYQNMNDFINDTLPESVRAASSDFQNHILPTAISEAEVIAELKNIASQNKIRKSYIGLGYYGCYTPAVIQRNVFENPSWYTAYTPYQPEISQGRLEALLNFQTMVSDLTGLDIANSSMLDEASAAAEAMLLARRANKKDSNVFLVDKDIFPQTKAVLETRAEPVGIKIKYVDLKTETQIFNCFAVLMQYPSLSGEVFNWQDTIELYKNNSSITIMATDLLALSVIKSPGELGADIAIGSTQRFGVPMGAGGPHAAFLSVRKGLERQMPGRLVGVSKDSYGNKAYRLSLQAREQHIRRDKATSNICTAQVLLGVMASFYAVYHGPEGIKNIAYAVHEKAVDFADFALDLGLSVQKTSFFDTVLIAHPAAKKIVEKLAEENILVFLHNDKSFSVAVDETVSEEDLVFLKNTLANICEKQGGKTEVQAGVKSSKKHGIPENLVRKTAFLTHKIFNTHHSETAMLRYISKLGRKDYALDRGMIPLGSCTMKLNAAVQMQSVSWPEFSNLHPFAPKEDLQGMAKIVHDISAWLAVLTGYDAVSIQPNAGSQGELAGLLAIKKYFASISQTQRNICIIPQSAHGTNAASAVLAGMRVVVTPCDDNGNIDMLKFSDLVQQHSDFLAAVMVTYPSTHGVFEEDITTLCDLVHEHGAQVYIDGANMNAMVGLGRFADLGGDVSHLNLHKTFCIPHGGGGPGVGPVAVKAHLAEFLPGHILEPDAQIITISTQSVSGSNTFNPTGTEAELSFFAPHGPQIAATNWGSASILTIPWAYIRLMGASGLRKASEVALLSANYIAKSISDVVPVLYKGKNSLVAHECIADIRFMQKWGVSVDDVAKRLIDYGFHAPTMSFPVAGTLMIEPTESEDIEEIDRFILALRSIVYEAYMIRDGKWNKENNPLKLAPFTSEAILDDAVFVSSFSRDDAIKISGVFLADKYWPPVSRIDQAWGDRNLICSCLPTESY